MAGGNKGRTTTRGKGSVMGNVRKALAGLALMVATITTASPALASNGYVCEGRVAYKDCGDHMEVWDYADPSFPDEPNGTGRYLYVAEQIAAMKNKRIVDWDYDPSGTYSGSGYDNPWQLTLTNADGSKMWTTSAATGSIEITPHTIADEPNTGTDLVIPSHVNGKPVTAIRTQAFGGVYGSPRDRACMVTSIELPSTITAIPDGFIRGKQITSVKLPDTIVSIGSVAFRNDTNLTSINVPKSLKTVGTDAFDGCRPEIQAQFARFTGQSQSGGSSSGGSSSSSQGTSTQRRITMYRLYNPNSGEHFYTANKGERDHTIAAGWTYEGVGWTAPKWGSPVFRLYNEYAGEHHYTMSLNERATLIACGWKDEGIGWESEGNGGEPLYRQYNPNAFANNHNYTLSKNENDTLVGIGWRAEGIAWYGMR